jgi:Domain of unknown function (DUF397)
MSDELTWVKSSHSGSQGDCVEVARTSGGTWLVRDTKDRDGSVLRFTAEQWRAFVTGIKQS